MSPTHTLCFLWTCTLFHFTRCPMCNPRQSAFQAVCWVTVYQSVYACPYSQIKAQKFLVQYRMVTLPFMVNSSASYFKFQLQFQPQHFREATKGNSASLMFSNANTAVHSNLNVGEIYCAFRKHSNLGSVQTFIHSMQTFSASFIQNFHQMQTFIRRCVQFHSNV